MKPLPKHIIVFFLVLLGLSALFSTYKFGEEKPTDISVSQLVEHVREGQIASIGVSGNEVIATRKDGKKEN